MVNNKKVTDHHAILPTLESCKRGSSSLSGDKEKVFALIVWKMQQAVQPPYIYEDVLVTVCCQDRKFTAKYKNVLQAGHTAMPVPCAEQEKKSKDMAFPKKLEQGEVIPVVSAEKKQGFTSPPKAFTEDTLLSAMESAGNKEFEKRHGKRKDWEHLRPVQRFWKSWYLPAMWNAKASRFFPVQRGLRQSQISRIT